MAENIELKDMNRPPRLGSRPGSARPSVATMTMPRKSTGVSKERPSRQGSVESTRIRESTIDNNTNTTLEPSTSTIEPSLEIGKSRSILKTVAKTRSSLHVLLESDIIRRHSGGSELSAVSSIDGSAGDLTQWDSRLFSDIDPQTGEKRREWSAGRYIVLVLLGSTFGDGGMQHFPAKFYTGGGLAYLIPYIIICGTLGYSMLVMEIALGQYCSRGCTACWQYARLFTGVGLAMIFCSLFIVTWFVRWNIKYFVLLAKEIRGEDITLEGFNVNTSNIKTLCESNLLISTLHNHTHMHAESNELNTEMVAYAFLVYFLVGISLFLPMYWLEKILAATAIIPYMLLFAVFCVVFNLDGAADGIVHYLVPDLSKLLTIKVWLEAATMAAFADGSAWGIFITTGSFDNINDNFMQLGFIILYATMLSNVCAGMVVFALLGHISYSCGMEIEEFSSSDHSHFDDAFLDQVAGVSLLMNPRAWRVVYSINRVVAKYGIILLYMEHIVTSLTDGLVLGNWWRRLLIPLVCLGCCALSLPFCTSEGGRLLEEVFLVNFKPITSLVLVISIGWVYGVDRFISDIKFMMGDDVRLLSAGFMKIYWRVMWKFVVPLMLAIIIISNLTTRKLEGDVEILCIFIEVTTVALIIGPMIYLVIKSKEASLIERIRSLTKPTKHWGPALFGNLVLRQVTLEMGTPLGPTDP